MLRNCSGKQYMSLATHLFIFAVGKCKSSSYFFDNIDTRSTMSDDDRVENL